MCCCWHEHRCGCGSSNVLLLVSRVPITAGQRNTNVMCCCMHVWVCCALQEFLDPARAAALVREQDYSYVIDCIDSIAPKVALLLAGHTAGVSTISSMGAGGRMDPSRVRLADVSETYNDAFAAVVRKRLRKAGVASGVTVVFSDEPAKPASLALTQQQYKRSYFGTSSYIPALFGLYIASHIIRQVVEGQGYKLPKAAGSTSSVSSKNGKAGRKAGSSSNSRNSRSSSLSSSDIADSQSASHIQPSPTQLGGPPPPLAAATGQELYKGYQRVKGVGMGFDGEGL